jgi:5'-phosphate synthase pdxT subunit
MKRIGVLALQGDFEAHRRALEELGVTAVEVRTAKELESVAALVIPGGESTTMLKLLDSEGLFEPLRAFGQRRPIFGTCAGAILLAREVLNPPQPSLGLVDVRIERNAYGRQVDSRVAIIRLEAAFPRPNGREELEAVFIRAPIVRGVGPEVRVLARYQGDPVLLEQGLHLVATFHPELSADRRVHRFFLDKIG